MAKYIEGLPAVGLIGYSDNDNLSYQQKVEADLLIQIPWDEFNKSQYKKYRYFSTKQEMIAAGTYHAASWGGPLWDEAVDKMDQEIEEMVFPDREMPEGWAQKWGVGNGQ